MKMTILSVVISMAVASIAETAFAASILNRDFETGDLRNWTVKNTEGGTSGISSATFFDTIGSGASNAATFRVGRNSDYFARGGIVLSQTVSIAIPGIHTFSADVGVIDSSGLTNAEGGLFELLIDGIVFDSVHFEITRATTLRGALNGKAGLGVGAVNLAIRISRGYFQRDDSPRQYIDNVSVVAPAAIPIPTSALALLPVPVPTSLPLLICGLGGLGYMAMRKRKAA